MEPQKDVQTTKSGDEIFIIKPEPKKPLDKKSISLTVALTFLGIVFLIVVLMVTLVGSAGGLADNYAKLAVTQLKKINSPIEDLEPSTVLNNRSIDSALGKIYVSKQSQPSLESTLFVGGLSSKYVKAENLEKNIKQHYEKLDIYTTQLTQLLIFDDGYAAIAEQEPSLLKRANPKDTLSIRSVGGSLEEFATEIRNLESPPQLSSLKEDLAATYSSRAEIYTKWAEALEAKSKSINKSSQAELKTLQDEAEALVTDENYTKLFIKYYQKLVKNQKALESVLSN